MSSLHQFMGYWSLCSFLQGSCMQITKMWFEISNIWGQWWKGGRQKKTKPYCTFPQQSKFYLHMLYLWIIYTSVERQTGLPDPEDFGCLATIWMGPGPAGGAVPKCKVNRCWQQAAHTQLTPRTAATQFQTACCPSRHRVPVGKVTLLLTS